MPSFARNSKGEREALADVLRARQELPGQDTVLLSTKGALLLCHAAPQPGGWAPSAERLVGPEADDEGGADEWAVPGVAGSGTDNPLGAALMRLRDEVCERHGLPPAWPVGLNEQTWEEAARECRTLCSGAAERWLLPRERGGCVGDEDEQP